MVRSNKVQDVSTIVHLEHSSTNKDVYLNAQLVTLQTDSEVVLKAQILQIAQLENIKKVAHVLTIVQLVTMLTMSIMFVKNAPMVANFVSALLFALLVNQAISAKIMFVYPE